MVRALFGRRSSMTRLRLVSSPMCLGTWLRAKGKRLSSARLPSSAKSPKISLPVWRRLLASRVMMALRSKYRSVIQQYLLTDALA